MLMRPEDPQSSHPCPVPPENLPKRRTYACHNCRKRKIKCDMSRPNCNNCVRRHTTCFYAPQPTPKSSKKSYIRSLEDRLEKMELMLEPLQVSDQPSPPRQPGPESHYPHIIPPLPLSTASSSGMNGGPSNRPIPTVVIDGQSCGRESHHPPFASSPRAWGETRGPEGTAGVQLPPLSALTDPHHMQAATHPHALPPLTAMTSTFAAATIHSSPLPPLTSSSLPFSTSVSASSSGTASPAYPAPVFPHDSGRHLHPLTASAHASMGSYPSALLTPPMHPSPQALSPDSSCSSLPDDPLTPCSVRQKLMAVEALALTEAQAANETDESFEYRSEFPPSWQGLTSAREIYHQMLIEYFEHFHPHIPFIHKATFLRLLHQGLIYPPILYGIYGVAARCSKRPQVVIQGANHAALEFLERARAQVHDDYVRPSSDVMAALILMCLTEIMCGDWKKFAMYTDMLIRMGRALNLPRLHSGKPPRCQYESVEINVWREFVCRVWWVVIFLDMLAAKYQHRRPTIKDEEVCLHYPCPTDVWDAPVYESPRLLATTASPPRVYDGYRNNLELTVLLRRLLIFKADVREHRYPDTAAFLRDYDEIKQAFSDWSARHQERLRSQTPLTQMDRVWYMSNQVLFNANVIALYYEIHRQVLKGSDFCIPRFVQDMAWLRCQQLAVDTVGLLQQNSDISPTQLVGFAPLEIAGIAQVFRCILHQTRDPQTAAEAQKHLLLLEECTQQCKYYWNFTNDTKIIEIHP